MSVDDWISLIREVAHTHREPAIRELLRRLYFEPSHSNLGAHWREVCVYAQSLDMERVAAEAEALLWLDGRRLRYGYQWAWRIPPARYEAIWRGLPTEVDMTGRTKEIATSRAIVEFLRARLWMPPHVHGEVAI